jgi:putative exporter of polyketide antibiotics
MFISNEYTFKTHRQNIIDGWSRSQFITSKLMDVLILSVIITTLYILVCLVTGFTNSGSDTNPLKNAYYTGLFALQTFAQLSIAFLIGFLVRKAFLALGIFIFYFMILENLLVGLFRWKESPVGHYMPLEISDRLVPPPAFFRLLDPQAYQNSLDAITLHIFLTIILTAIIWAICYRVNNKRDLK